MKRIQALLAGLLLAATFIINWPVASAAPAPFGLPGRQVVSPDGVAYTIYSGKVASWDGLPLAAEVTIPAGARGPLPLVVMFHGWTQSRSYWMSPTVSSPNPDVNDWNNVAFAARGYAVLNYTIRGWHDSCGPKSAAVPSNPATLPAECASREYWIHVADPRYEIRDAQHLIGRLVDDGVARPDRIGVTGQSYGGGHSWLLALLNDRTVNLDGSYAPWTSPNGTPLKIAAAVPKYTWSSLWNALLPNGRASNSGPQTPELMGTPVGVPLQTYIDGLFAAGQPLGNGYYSPPGLDPSSDLVSWNARLSAGNPYTADPTLDPLVYRARQEYERRSPLHLTPDDTVPVYQIQGTTDPLFPALQGVQMRHHVLAWNPKYPVKSFFGDVGHSNANNPADVWALANATGHEFFSYYLKGKGQRPTFDVTATTTTCVPGQTRQVFKAASWAGLSSSTIVLTSDVPQVTGSAAANPEGPATDPIVNKGCRTTQLLYGTGAAAWTFPVTQPYTLVGDPELTVDFVTTGSDAQLNVRIWDVAPDGQTQTLVTRGVYRHLGTPGGAAQVTFQVSANIWQYQTGHSLRLEVLGNDTPNYQLNNIPSVTTITGVRLALPVR